MRKVLCIDFVRVHPVVASPRESDANRRSGAQQQTGRLHVHVANGDARVHNGVVAIATQASPQRPRAEKKLPLVHHHLVHERQRTRDRGVLRRCHEIERDRRRRFGDGAQNFDRHDQISDAVVTNHEDAIGTLVPIRERRLRAAAEERNQCAQQCVSGGVLYRLQSHCG